MPLVPERGQRKKMITDIFVIAIAMILNGLITGAELAVLSCNKMKIRQKADMGDTKALAIKRVLEEPEKIMPSVAITYTVLGVFVGTYSGLAFAGPITEWLLSFGFMQGLQDTTLEHITTIIMTVVISYFSIVFAETIPKTYAVNNSEKIAYKVIGILIIIAKVLSPIAKLLVVSAEVVMKLLRINGEKIEERSTEEDILMMIEDSEKVGLIAGDEKEMIHNVFAFNDKTAEEIATHRTEIVGLDFHATHEEILAVINEDHSRIPVYEGDIDDIKGVVHIKDVMKQLIEKPQGPINLSSIMRRVEFFPASKKLDDLFHKMQDDKISLSIIIDEYGGTFGIVTMEDMIEEVMGEIYDEYDEIEPVEIVENPDGSYLIQGTTNIDDVNKLLEIELSTEEHDTLSGFVIGQLGQIPEEDDDIQAVEIEGYVFQTCGVAEKRITELLVTKQVVVPEPDDLIEEQ